MGETILAVPAREHVRRFGAAVRFLPLRFRDPALRRYLGEFRAVLKTPELEADPSLKQAVVYTVLRSEGEGRPGRLFWLYRRPGQDGDARLYQKLSLGVGGHVRDSDVNGDDSPQGGLARAAARELGEEVGLPGLALTFRGLVNYEGDGVGRCHVGFVFTADVPHAQSLVRPSERSGVAPLGWFTGPALWRLLDSGQKFEPWSFACLGALRSWGE